MKRLLFSMFAAALGVVLSAGTTWAGPVYTYDWTPSSLFVAGDLLHNGIDFSNNPAQTVATPTVVGNASSLTIDNATSDTFTSEPYTLKVKLTDGAQTPQTLFFNGVFNGAIVNGTATTLSAATTPPTSQTATFGNGDTFVVSLAGFVPPSSFGGKPGGLGFSITANGGSGSGPGNPGGGTNDTPEPSTVLLSLLGIGGLGLKAWRKRKLVTA